MRHIKSIISKRLKKLNSIEISDKEICIKLEEIIKQKSASLCSALFYKNKTLHISCSNSMVANEMYLIQEELKDEINKFFDKKVLNKIIVKTK
jgi:hypothetical protein